MPPVVTSLSVRTGHAARVRFVISMTDPDERM
jgi:hypothetical protein